MTRKFKLLTLLSFLIISLLAVGVVSADTISGVGWLEAEGNGRANLRGNVERLQISGNGVLWYFDGGEEDIPTVTGAGRVTRFDNGWVRYAGFHGTFELTEADQTIVRLTGRNIELMAEGRGTVWLRGSGTYTYGSSIGETITGEWTPDGNSIPLGVVE